MGPKDEVVTGGGPGIRARGPAGALEDLAAIDIGPDVADVEQVDEEIIGELTRGGGEDTVGGPVVVGVEDTEATDQDGQLGWGQGQEVGLVDEELLRLGAAGAPAVVAEPIGVRLEVAKRRRVGLVLGGVHTTGCEGDGDVGEAGGLGGGLDGGTAAQDDQVGEGDLGGGRALDALEGGQDAAQVGARAGVDGPADLGLQADPGAVGPAALVGVAEGGGGGPGGGDELGHAEAGGEDLGLEVGDLGVAQGRGVGIGEGILPDQLLGGNLWSEVAGSRTHITVGQFEPIFRELVNLYVYRSPGRLGR